MHDGGIIKEEKKKEISKFMEFDNDIIRIDVLTLKEIRVIIEQVARNIYEIVTDDLQQTKSMVEFQSLQEEESFYESVLEQCLQEKKELEERINDLEGILESIGQDIEEWYEENYIPSQYDGQDYPPEEE